MGSNNWTQWVKHKTNKDMKLRGTYDKCWNPWGSFRVSGSRYIVQMDGNNKNSIVKLYVNILHEFLSNSIN